MTSDSFACLDANHVYKMLSLIGFHEQRDFAVFGFNIAATPAACLSAFPLYRSVYVVLLFTALSFFSPQPFHRASVTARMSSRKFSHSCRACSVFERAEMVLTFQKPIGTGLFVFRNLIEGHAWVVIILGNDPRLFTDVSLAYSFSTGATY